MNKIIGAGGGKGGGGSVSVPAEIDDTLRTVASVAILDGIGEGEIEGLVDGLKSVYLDDTPILNEDGEENFAGVSVAWRYGTLNQTPISGFSGAESEQNVGVKVEQANPITRTITSANLTHIAVRVQTPRLTEIASNDKYHYEDYTYTGTDANGNSYTETRQRKVKEYSKGDLVGSSIELKIELNGVQVASDTISGKTTQLYERVYRFAVDSSASWDVRVTRVSDDAPDSNTNNDLYWASYTEIIDDQLSYPNTALIAISADASQFSAIPTRSYDVKLLKVQIPNNYNPLTRTYSGTWNGGFVVAWTDNPAWVYYDLCTNERYGLGEYLDEAQVDKWGLYEIARYCDELVDDGNGGTEPRYTCNIYLQTRQQAFKVLRDIASIFRGMLYIRSGQIFAAADMPSSIRWQFTQANVVDGAFVYSAASVRSRVGAVLVQWNDPDDAYRQKIEYVEDVDIITKYGYQETSVTAVGCTSQSQANRVGRWLLYTNRYEQELVQFSTTAEASLLVPGDIIQVADAHRAGARAGGRVSAVAGAQITLDKALDFSAATLHIITESGELGSYAVQSVSGAVVTLTSAPSGIAAQAIWTAESSALETQLFRVISIAEGGEGEMTIEAVAYLADKYGYIEEGLELEPREISVISDTPAKPEPEISEYQYNDRGQVKTRVVCSWPDVPSATTYVVSWRRHGLSNYRDLSPTSSPIVEIDDAQEGEYYFKVSAKNALGKQSAFATAQEWIWGNIAPPADVQGFDVGVYSDYVRLKWLRSEDLDVQIGGKIIIRYTPDTASPIWDAASYLAEAPGDATSLEVEGRAGAYLAKFVDQSGVYSDNAAMVITTLPALLPVGSVWQDDDAPHWGGVKDAVVAIDGTIALEYTTLIDDVTAQIDDLANFDSLDGDNATDGYYYFDFNGSDELNLGAGQLVRVTAEVTGSLLAPSAAEAGANLQIKLYTDGEWGEWQNCNVGDFNAERLQARVHLFTGDETVNFIVSSAKLSVDIPIRTESEHDVDSGAGLYDVVYSRPFYNVPALNVTASDLDETDRLKITNATKTGFTIAFYSSSNVLINRNFDWVAQGI